MNSNWESQLKSARSSKGLSLEECSDLTKIPISFLVSLENGDFRSLPAKIYSEFHIKKYFSFLGVNPKTCLQEYSTSISELNFEKKVEEEKKEKKEKNKYLSFLINFPYLVPTIFIFSVFSLILTKIIPESDDFVDEKELLENLVEIENKEVFLEDQKEKSTLKNTSLPKTKDVENGIDKSTEIEPDIIKIVVSEESWIIIEEGNDKNLIYELMQNEEREVLGYRPLIFKIGNPEATKILINNKIINISKISKKDANYSYFEIR